MNFQSCRNTSDAVPLYLPQQLFLKPIARLHVSVQLPSLAEPGNTISNWEVMEKLKLMIKPDEFCGLKVLKSTLEFIRFEAELEDKSKIERIAYKLDNNHIKLSGFSDSFKVRAMEAKSDFPTRHTWDSYFRDAKNMDEMKPGERPDTIHISHLPIKWFVPKHLLDAEDAKPSENLFHRIFQKFGDIRYVDIPICDPYRSKMKSHMTGIQTFSFNQELFFEGYVQFRDYISFVRAMDAFRNMKLVHKEGDKAYAVNIKVDFDKTKHLSDASIRRRQIVRDRLVSREREQEDRERKLLEEKERELDAQRQRELDAKAAKERRQHDREERRKAQQLSLLKAKESEEINKKIAMEEKKLMQAQRKLQAIRLMEELFRRIKVKKENELLKKKLQPLKSKNEETQSKIEGDLEQQRNRLRKTVEERETIKAVLGLAISNSSNSSDSDSKSNKKKTKSKKKKKKKKQEKSDKNKSEDENSKKTEEKPPEGFPGPTQSNTENPYLPMNPNWYGYAPMYPNPRGPLYPGPSFFPFPPRGRGVAPRGFFPRPRGGFNPNFKRGWRGRGGPMVPYIPGVQETQEEYYRYFKRLAGQERDDRSYSRSRSRSRSYSRSHSYSRSRSRSHSSHRSHRSSRKSRSHSRSRRRSESRDRRSRSRSRSRSRRSRSHHRRSHSSRRRSHSHSKNGDKHSRSKSRDKRSRSKSEDKRSRSRSYKSVDSSKFISPNRLRARKSRSKSWSLPRNNGNKCDRSWSKSPG